MSQSGYQKELKGYSGCKIFIIENENTRFVRKFSSDEKYNERLQAQCNKQAQCSFAKVPKVLDSGFQNGLFYFDMEYMRGKLLSEYLLQVPAFDLDNVISRLFKLVSPTLSNNNNPEVVSKIREKIDSLRYLTAQYKNLISVFEHLDSCQWFGIDSNDCHGDLTLENIIVLPNGDFVLIDFLDSFVNCSAIDTAKILQDLLVRWSYRNKKLTTYDDIRLYTACDIFIDKLKQAHANVYRNSIDMLILNILRIYPYLKDEQTQLFLDNAVKKLLERYTK